MILTDNIISYIPQRAPFVLVDELLDATDTYSKTSFNICEEHLFVKGSVLTEPGLIENMAQTAAAGIGANYCEGKKNTIGFIGAIKSLVIEQLPEVGQQIITEIAFLRKMMNTYIIRGSIYLEDKLIASCELSVFVQEKD